jgi:hypothetical protein
MAAMALRRWAPALQGAAVPRAIAARRALCVPVRLVPLRHFSAAPPKEAHPLPSAAQPPAAATHTVQAEPPAPATADAAGPAAAKPLKGAAECARGRAADLVSLPPCRRRHGKRHCSAAHLG